MNVAIGYLAMRQASYRSSLYDCLLTGATWMHVSNTNIGHFSFHVFMRWCRSTATILTEKHIPVSYSCVLKLDITLIIQVFYVSFTSI